jgi:cytochrome P450 family 71 subfamily A
VRQVVAGTTQGVRGEQLGSMLRLQAALKEAMRLHMPVLLLIPRDVIQDTRIHGYDVPAGTRLTINAWAIGRDEVSRRTTRTSGRRGSCRARSTITARTSGSYRLALGGGDAPARAAFGTRLAKLALANLMYHLNWELPQARRLSHSMSSSLMAYWLISSPP